MFDLNDARKTIALLTMASGSSEEELLDLVTLGMKTAKAEVYKCGSEEEIAQWESLFGKDGEPDAYTYLAFVGEGVMKDLYEQTDPQELNTLLKRTLARM